ncbi:hypothetical protein KPL71_023812 [Citrus sinensis]|uniref:Uncharacterized protein n=2 Tax=Citrus sinensis TaxID=2711 RepID=A0ACB8ILH8_CITSI|nr:hypothetical protein KPL71_023812 [Citrus sinensis]KAH9697930.1 hypothetical protein KPL71_023812 [Citrus sinensis]
MANEGSSRPKRRVKQWAGWSPTRPPLVIEFEKVHFPSPSLARRFQTCFMTGKVTDSFFIDLVDFEELVVCSSNVKEMLASWENALNIEEKVYPNLVRNFYSNMDLSATRLDKLVTYVGGLHVEFTVEDLNSILRTDHVGLELYTSRKELQFNCFSHIDVVRNICRRRDLSDDVCSLPFRSKLFPMQIRILHSILQHIIIPRKGHNDEVTRLDVVNNRLLPYGSIITRILRHFRIPITEPVYDDSKRLGREIVLEIGFHRRNGEWVKTTSSKNEDTLLASEDNSMLNDIYFADKLPNFRLGARPRVPHRATTTQAKEPKEKHERDLDTDVPLTFEDSSASEGLMQQILSQVRTLSLQPQQLASRLDSF